LVESNAKVPALKVDNEQYQFVLDDLIKTSENKNIDWIFLLMHKPMYSSISKQLEEYLIRDKYQGVFDKYNVDLVIQGHNHIYSRTLPLSFNKFNLSQPIADQIGNSNSNNNNNNNNNKNNNNQQILTNQPHLSSSTPSSISNNSIGNPNNNYKYNLINTIKYYKIL